MSSLFKKQFALMDKHARTDSEYKQRVELGLVITLFLAILTFFAFQKLPQQIRRIELRFSDDFIAYDLPPATKSRGAPQAPTLPQIPIPAEDLFIPDDDPIEIIDLNLFEGNFLDIGKDGDGELGGAHAAPKPILDVIPDYPEKLKKRGVEGVVLLSILINTRGLVDSVRVVGNTSGSHQLERNAVAAAYKCRYTPFNKRQMQTAFWIERPYTFKGK